MVVFALADGFETTEALTPVDILRRCGVDVCLAGVYDKRVLSSHGVCVISDRLLGEVNVRDISMLVLPGGELGVENLQTSPLLHDIILDLVNRNVWVAAICAAPVLLAEMSLLNGKRAVCYPGMQENLTAYGARYAEDENVVTDGKIITARAAGDSFDFGFKLAEVLAGADKSAETARKMHFERRGLSTT